MPPKIILVGSSCFEPTALNTVLDSLYTIESVPDNFPPNCLSYLGDVSILFLQYCQQKHPSLTNISEWRKVTDLPIVFVSEDTSKDHIISAIRQGATDFLSKESETEEILACLQRHIQPEKEKEEATNRGIFGIVAPFFKKADRIHPPSPQQIQVVVNFLGTFSVHANETAIHTKLSKQRRSILAYLLFHRHKKVNRDRLLHLFWANSSEDSARNNLNVAIHAIRKAFAEAIPNEEVLLFDQYCYSISTHLGMDIDIEQVHTHWEKGRTFESKGDAENATNAFTCAYAYCKGGFLEDMLYEPWTEQDREHLKERLIVILNRLARYFLEEKRLDLAELYALKMLAQDNCLEEGHRILMNVFDHTGRSSKAIRQYNNCIKILKDRLGIYPSKKTKLLYEKITGGRIK